MQTETPLIPKMSGCAEEMSTWSKDHCNKVKVDIENVREELE